MLYPINVITNTVWFITLAILMFESAINMLRLAGKIFVICKQQNIYTENGEKINPKLNKRVTQLAVNILIFMAVCYLWTM